jgi:hypothetical protein
MRAGGKRSRFVLGAVVLSLTMWSSGCASVSVKASGDIALDNIVQGEQARYTGYLINQTTLEAIDYNLILLDKMIENEKSPWSQFLDKAAVFILGVGVGYGVNQWK